MSTIACVTDAKQFGNAVRTARKEQHLSQRELAQRSGCSQRLVSEIERGKQTAELGKALSLLTTLGLTLVVQGDVSPARGREAVARTVQAVTRRLEQQERPRPTLADYLRED